MEHADVLIVGGGPAGSACAGALVAEGRDALVIDDGPGFGDDSQKLFRPFFTTKNTGTNTVTSGRWLPP